jgi:hypothetical protein
MKVTVIKGPKRPKLGNALMNGIDVNLTVGFTIRGEKSSAEGRGRLLRKNEDLTELVKDPKLPPLRIAVRVKGIERHDAALGDSTFHIKAHLADGTPVMLYYSTRTTYGQATI